MAQEILEYYDNLIVGGGIVGAGIFRDLSLHDEQVLLIDRGNFCEQTSARSSKMLHGGIRYLENFDFALVMEALQEKNFWAKHSPHLIEEKKFILPVYKNSKWPLPFMVIAVFLYDLLSLFKNPRFGFALKKKTLRNSPFLKREGLRGSVSYSDAIMDDKEIGVVCIKSSIKDNAHAIENTLFQSCYKKDSEWYVKIIYKNEEKTIRCKNLIFSLGPFTDKVLSSVFKEWTPRLIPSKGSHIWIKKSALNIESPIVLQTKDNRVIFVIPHKFRILVGTTETKCDEEFYNIKPSREEISYLLHCLNAYFPNVNINKSHIEDSFAGIRPLVSEGNKKRGKVSRKHIISEIDESCYVIMGGKYTTFRLMARDIVKMIFKKEKKKYIKELTKKSFNF